MEKHPESHFFMDEYPVGINGLQPKDLKDLSDELSEDQFLWIACQTQKSPPSGDIESIGSHNWNFNYFRTFCVAFNFVKNINIITFLFIL